MPNDLRKADFKKHLNYSETTYQRRMKEFKKSPYKAGYKAVTAKEIWIDLDLYSKFRDWYATNSLKVKKDDGAA
ncbi:hypothetical protein [Enterococcus termitis]|uniref:Excisionase n=1 Tax=Enterococcus termitis TaxID=332950 RepID=A0A1E5GZQ6_9ENTE|nr:hypothetical protein [Enterococcus termitis]OEG18178.1 hypothetical protein BCR25_16945 [Enterococcus termitis]OJG97213.1 hypothetical protein RV18_GL001078 [Enterococcus termitis]